MLAYFAYFTTVNGTQPKETQQNDVLQIDTQHNESQQNDAQIIYTQLDDI
jgi:hypothetical protein